MIAFKRARELFEMKAGRSDYALRLDYNELPYNPPQIGKEIDYNHYPEEENTDLINSIARFYRLPQSEIAVTHGVDEALDRFIQLFPNNSFVLFTPTFHGFTERLNVNESNTRHYTLSPDFRIALSDISNLTKNDVVIIASPNNPTGHLFTEEEITQLLEAAHTVLVDETYIDFSSSKGWLAKRPDRMFIYRSFSKSFGLAGLRAGFLVGPSSEMESIRRKQWFCHMSSPVISMINHALSSKWRYGVIKEVIQERERVIQELQRMRFDVRPTETNFIILKDTFGVIADELDQNDICVKHAVHLGLPGYLRVTIDTPTNNNLFLKALASLSLAAADRREELTGFHISAA